jgi:stringent starvation protein B
MVTPYLNSDESIILTTHNVNFNSIVTELILTNQRLIIFDTKHAQFRYQTIPLSTIETVFAREDAQGNPAMYLSISPMTADSAPQSKEFTFLRQRSGERKQECDAWIKHVKGQIASIRQQALPAPQTSSSDDTDIIFDEPKTTIVEPVPEESAPPESVPEPQPSMAVPAPEDTLVDTGDATGLPDSAPEAPESDEQVPQAAAEDIQKEPQSSGTPPPPASPEKPKAIMLTAVIIVILAIAGGIFLYSTMPGGNSVEPSAPVITSSITTAATIVPTPSVQQTPAPLKTIVPTPQPTVIIPESGVWVKVHYEGNYYGRVGTSGDMKIVNASGEQFYQLTIVEGIVEATIQKQDGSGKVLTVEVYQNGVMVARSTKATPFATVDLRTEVKKG